MRISLRRFKWLIFLASLGLLTGTTMAQSTTISVTVTDLGGQVWKNGTISYVFQPNPSYSGTYQWNGSALPSTYLTPHITTLSSSGAASFSIPNSTLITPAGSSWKYVICPNATSPCTVLYLGTTGSTQNISSQVTAITPAIFIQAGPMPIAYTDAEITTIPNQGGIYFNVTSFLPKYFDGANWQFYGGGGGGGVTLINGVGGAFTFTGSGVTCVTTTCTFSGGSMVYPSAGIPNSTGSAWGTSFTINGTAIGFLDASQTWTGTTNAFTHTVQAVSFVVGGAGGAILNNTGYNTLGNDFTFNISSANLFLATTSNGTNVQIQAGNTFTLGALSGCLSADSTTHIVTGSGSACGTITGLGPQYFFSASNGSGAFATSNIFTDSTGSNLNSVAGKASFRYFWSNPDNVTPIDTTEHVFIADGVYRWTWLELQNIACGSSGNFQGSALVAGTGTTENSLLVGHLSPCDNVDSVSPDTNYIVGTGAVHQAFGTAIATITNVALTSNVVTITASNSYSAGQYVQPTGLSGASFLNFQTGLILTATSTQFTYAFTHANYTSTPDSGNAEIITDNVISIGMEGSGTVNIGGSIHIPQISLRSGVVPNGVFLPGLTSLTCLGTDSNGKVGAGTCSGGAVSSVTNSDGTLTISPTVGSVIASLALGHANTWGATQTNTGLWIATLPSGTVNQGGFDIGTLSFSDTGIITSLQGSLNSYLQMIMQNTNSGASASTDFIIGNDQQTSTTHFLDMGMNSSGFTGTGNLQLAGAGYIYTMTGDLVLGTNSANTIHIVYNNGSTDTVKIDTNGFQLPLIATSASTAVACFNGTNGALTNVGCASGSGSGTVTSIATTGPITGGTITSTGTIACATCVTSAASLTGNQLVLGANSQGIKVLPGFTTDGAGTITLGVSGTTAGGLQLVNNTSGGITLITPSTGALGSSLATFPINTGTIAEINLAQTWSALQTFSAGINLSGTTSPLQFSGSAGTSGNCAISGGAGVTPTWGACGSGFSNPMTTLGDIIYGGASGVATRLAGQTTAATYILSETATGSAVAPVWLNLASTAKPIGGTTGTFSGAITATNGTFSSSVSAVGTSGFAMGSSGAEGDPISLINNGSGNNSAVAMLLTLTNASFSNYTAGKISAIQLVNTAGSETDSLNFYARTTGTTALVFSISSNLGSIAGLQATGTKFTTSGCSVSSTTGGGTAGRFILGANTCSVVITMNGATGLTASNGWSCYANDRTSTTVFDIQQTADTTTTATFAIPATAGATDVISFGCIAY